MRNTVRVLLTDMLLLWCALIKLLRVKLCACLVLQELGLGRGLRLVYRVRQPMVIALGSGARGRGSRLRSAVRRRGRIRAMSGRHALDNSPL